MAAIRMAVRMKFIGRVLLRLACPVLEACAAAYMWCQTGRSCKAEVLTVAGIRIKMTDYFEGVCDD
jgi:hypothetical protein